MDLQSYSRNEMFRRIELLPQEVGAWHGLAQNNIQNLGIHQTQFDALKIMMDGLFEKQRELYDSLAPIATDVQFAEKYLSLTDEVVGAFDLWRIFRQILAQRKEEIIGRAVDSADLIAADCYLHCMNQARSWGLIQEKQFREPPLTYLEADISPSTAGRGNAVESLGFPVRRYRNMRLPIPIVLMPFDNADSIWMFCHLHHEVGHNLDQDLRLSADFFNPLLNKMTARGVPESRQRLWSNWTGEILADAFGILLGGAGFAYALCNWLLILVPSARFAEINVKDAHPAFFVRIRLIVSMLRQFDIPAMNAAAAAIENVWDSLSKPVWISDFAADCDFIADVFLNEKLNALGDARSLIDFNPRLADDMLLAEQVAVCLPTNFACPDPNFIRFPFRLVPVAAQLAVAGQSDSSSEKLNAIQKNALGYLERIARPQFLGGENRQEFLRELTRQLDFTAA